ncbi:hypothetical protein ES703_104352 [subsurface metagenome]
MNKVKRYIFLSPAKYKIPITIPIYITAVPISGCNIISIIGNPARKIVIKRWKKFTSSSFFLDKKPAKVIIIPILKNSDGCIFNIPHPIQLLAP